MLNAKTIGYNLPESGTSLGTIIGTYLFDDKPWIEIWRRDVQEKAAMPMPAGFKLDDQVVMFPDGTLQHVM